MHPHFALTPLRTRSLKLAGRYADGNGLYLVVDSSGAKRWLLRTVVQGRRRDIGLGGLRLVTLAEAREAARTYRKIARDGGDPLAERRKARQTAPTFTEAARAVHKQHAPAWRNPKHGDQWINSLTDYAFPIIGAMRVDQITAPDVLRVLSPIWLAKAETARRVRQRMRSVFDWAKASGHRSGDNPVDGVARGLPKQPDRQRHHAALPYAEIARFIRSLRASTVGEPAKLAFELLILTATRTSETLNAGWTEFDLDERIWTIPPERMKAGRAHRIPLSPRAVEILARAKELAGDSTLVFPGRKRETPMSNMVFLTTLRRMDLEVTAHGFRSGFRDWAAERTNFAREVCEMALAHTIRDKAEAAYRRGDLLDKRRQLMSAWAAYATAKSADIVPLRAG
ncbi:tyrosine-type recombinase/integrase [Terricaulis silvestris]|uniref:Prophage CPS-53 integrase n=1 Tax=Terricaulis silvestris TaxID=2686094 RepID=A0A6I6ML88_9CAUL|nr:site-specific integrase [Terricaulis silvestris]QGZ93427.1 Putative prophage CPS-53 integrase [Terricaulis silvestris]